MSQIRMTDVDLSALRDSEDRFQAFMRHSPMLAFIKDAEGRYVYMNPRMEEVFGVVQAELVGKTDGGWMPEVAAARAREADQAVLSGGEAVEALESFMMPDGVERHWMVIKFPFTKVTGERFVGGVGVEITALKAAEERLSDSEERYRRLFESSMGLICTHTLDGLLLSANPAAARALGYQMTELVGRDMREFLAPDLRPQFDRYLQRIKAEGTDDGLMLLTDRVGDVRTWKYHNVLIHDVGKPDYVLGNAQDVTLLQRAQEAARELSLTDELTGLYNRRGFLALAGRHLGLLGTRDTLRRAMLVYADMDGLKKINDEFGHEVGSDALAQLADILRSTFRASDILGRLGGDEFVVLMVDAQDDSGETVRERLRRKLAVFNALGRLPFELSLSVGTWKVNADSPLPLTELLDKADQAMYEQKRRTRGTRESAEESGEPGRTGS
ncbi:MAG: sensor domain-containing diguanylate cyclase [Acidobacteriota bacterium]